MTRRAAAGGAQENVTGLLLPETGLPVRWLILIVLVSHLYLLALESSLSGCRWAGDSAAAGLAESTAQGSHCYDEGKFGQTLV